MRTISNEELVVVAGGDGYDFIDDEDRKSLGLSPFGNGGGAPTNWGTVNSSGDFTQGSAAPYVEPKIDTSLVCGGTGLKPESSTTTVAKTDGTFGVDLNKTNPSFKAGTGGTTTTTVIVCK